MSLLAKLREQLTRQAAQEAATKAADPGPPRVVRPPLKWDYVRNPENGPSRRTRTKGRPRKLYGIHDTQTRLEKAIRDWAQERLVVDPDNFALLGSLRVLYKKTPSGVLRYLPSYPQRTLSQDFNEWCAVRNLPPPILTSFAGQVILALAERGIPAQHGRSSERRRKGLRGVRLLGEAAWTGKDLPRQKRKE
jgi:hypothetical protein